MSNVDAFADPHPPAGGIRDRSYKELAIWALICAIWVLGPIGIILALLARKKMQASNNFDGQNIAPAAIIVGAITTAIDGAFVVLGHFAFDLQTLVGWAINACVPLYFVLQIWFGYAWSGRWRIAALVPLILFVPVLIYTLLGLLHGSNLWPLLLIFSAPFGVAYLLVVRVARAIVNRRTVA